MAGTVAVRFLATLGIDLVRSRRAQHNHDKTLEALCLQQSQHQEQMHSMHRDLLFSTALPLVSSLTTALIQRHTQRQAANKLAAAIVTAGAGGSTAAAKTWGTGVGLVKTVKAIGLMKLGLLGTGGACVVALGAWYLWRKYRAVPKVQETLS